MDIIRGLLRRKLLERSHVGTLVDDNAVEERHPTFDIRQVSDNLHLVAGGAKLGDVPLCEHLDAAANRRPLKIYKNLHI